MIVADQDIHWLGGVRDLSAADVRWRESGGLCRGWDVANAQAQMSAISGDAVSRARASPQFVTHPQTHTHTHTDTHKNTRAHIHTEQTMTHALVLTS